MLNKDIDYRTGGLHRDDYTLSTDEDSMPREEKQLLQSMSAAESRLGSLRGLFPCPLATAALRMLWV